ncbi:DedA family protein [Pseudomonas sp. phDV1]|nr:YqaA family protein [Pseudomonas sp. phDV1]AXO61436.1 DedA family protein [Pseudomonas sp. phDV1]
MWDLSAYLGLFLAAFGAATLLPMQSEAVLVGLLLAAEQPPALLLLVATTGNVLGSAANWLLGRYIEHLRHRRWFPVPEDKLQRARQAYQRYGRWSLLLSWVPIIGDPLTVIAGVLREPFWSILLIVLVAKAGRYLVLAVLTLGVMR